MKLYFCAGNEAPRVRTSLDKSDKKYSFWIPRTFALKVTAGRLTPAMYTDFDRGRTGVTQVAEFADFSEKIFACGALHLPPLTLVCPYWHSFVPIDARLPVLTPVCPHCRSFAPSNTCLPLLILVCPYWRSFASKGNCRQTDTCNVHRWWQRTDGCQPGGRKTGVSLPAVTFTWASENSLDPGPMCSQKPM